MEKRTILAIIITFFIILLWGVIQSKYFPSTPEKPPAKEEKQPPQAASAPEPKTQEKVAATQQPSIGKGKPAPVAKEIPKKEVSIETQNYWAVVTSEGGTLKQFRLKKYLDRVEQSPMVLKLTNLVRSLLGKPEKVQKKPEPVNLVNTVEKEGLPLGMVLAGTAPALLEGNWEVDKEQLALERPGEKGEVSFTKELANGLKLSKRYGFSSTSDVVDLELVIQNTSLNEISLQPGIDWIGRVDLQKLAEEENKDFGLKYAYLKNDKVEIKDLGVSGSSGCTPGCESVKTKIESFQVSEKGNIQWFAFAGEFFTALLIPPPSKEGVTLTVSGDEKNFVKADLLSAPLVVSPGQTIKIPYRIYLGPKEIEALKGLGVGADKLIHFGFFTIVAKPLLWLLNLTHQVTKNFGIDIIILSILLKVIFLPLTQISLKSMKEMQKVQPEMARLKEMYKNDKARIQQEIMLLYKRRKINPLSGCLPMLIQIPVFIALYNVLQNTFEMRHAPFLWWINDLSAKDPIYITPLIMGATMVIQQKMTPSAADPAQAKLFMLMPIMFTFLFLSLPSGLVLYWLVTNVLSIAHQYYMTKKT
jgi:YidC/Oxa1 family membrane protein insertase